MTMTRRDARWQCMACGDIRCDGRCNPPDDAPPLQLRAITASERAAHSLIARRWAGDDVYVHVTNPSPGHWLIWIEATQ